MNISHLATLDLQLKHPTWLWYSDRIGCFMACDTKDVYSVSPSPCANVRKLESEGSRSDLPIEDLLYEEFTRTPWAGLYFLGREWPESMRSGLLVHLHFAPNCGIGLLHGQSKLLIRLRSKQLELLSADQSAERTIATTRTRGRVIFAFGAHPTEPLIVYGDNYGTFYAQWFSHEGFGRTKKIVDKIQSGNSVCFINEGRTLLLGGSGYVQLYKYEDGKFLLEQEMSTAVRHLVWIESKQVLAINQGMHGVALYQLSDGKLTTLERVPTELAVQHLAFSNTFKEMAVLFQEQTQLSIYAIDC